MDKHPLGKTFDKITKDLQVSINNAMNHLQFSMQEYLANSIDANSLLRVIENLGLSSIIGVAETPISGLDYYKVLGLEKTASNEEVKERYRNIITKIHPDVSGREMTFLSVLVNTAYGMICKERRI